MDFRQAEQRLKQLKTQFEAGTLTETDLKAKLEDLMIRDEQGHWWMIGYETGRWYRHDGTNWEQSDLPGSPLQKSISIPNWIAILWITLGWATGVAIWRANAWTIGGLIGGLVTAITLLTEKTLSSYSSLLWITLAWGIGGTSATLIGQQIPGGIGYPIGWAFGWLIGGLVTAIILRAEHVLTDWSNLLWIIMAWTAGGILAGFIGGKIDWTLGGAIGGALGGSITIWQIRKKTNTT
jgi:hypothetical protein